ncbi:MAG: hypothetical protein CTY12_00810 [Methylotenera sp.]|nr:MAG: hypothetical protein CTY12_00810 [Methylotenera sp.]
MKIKEIVEGVSGKGYGSLTLESSSVDKIKALCKEIGVNGIISKLHITVIYDRSNPNISMKLDNTKKYKATVDGVKCLGEPDSKWYAIALELTSPEITAVHKKYIDAGFKHSYPNFIPHLSLKYQPSKEEIELIKDNLNKFKGLELVFSNERMKVIDE